MMFKSRGRAYQQWIWFTLIHKPHLSKQAVAVNDCAVVNRFLRSGGCSHDRLKKVEPGASCWSLCL